MDELQQQRLVIMNLIARAKSTTIEKKGSDVEMSDEESVSCSNPRRATKSETRPKIRD